jgi:cellulose synthase/poly-beta-1,6-N-acetylglucosamine synthase-like glycosyltransferase
MPEMSESPLSFLLWGISIVSSAPSLIFSSEILASTLPSGRAPTRKEEWPIRIAVLVPAHNESAGIGGTVRHIKEQLGPDDRLIVIADNCTDNTAEVARSNGAQVLERNEPAHRGKGYALSYGAEALTQDPPDIVLIMDADCRVRKGDLRGLAQLSHTRQLPVQAVYLMDRPDKGTPISGVSAFAFAVRNLVRPLGLKRLGFPCLLTGTGMAFPWTIYRDAPPTHSFLVEDLLLGHELALRGTPPLLNEDIIVVSELPEGEAAGFKQRRRWEHGQLSVLKAVTPRLLREGFRQQRLGLVVLALDGLVPPLALLVFMQLLAVLVLWLGGAVGLSAGPAIFSSFSFLLLGLGVGYSWFRYGRHLLSLRDLMSVPRYILWKLPLYKTFVRSGAHAEWERTER